MAELVPHPPLPICMMGAEASFFNSFQHLVINQARDAAAATPPTSLLMAWVMMARKMMMWRYGKHARKVLLHFRPEVS